MKYSISQKICSIALAFTMLASSPGSLSLQSGYAFAEESTESGLLSAASDDSSMESTEGTDGSWEDPSGGTGSDGDAASSGGSSETIAPPEQTSDPAPGHTDASVHPEQAGTGNASAAPVPESHQDDSWASLPGMEDEIAVDHEASSGFEEETLTERTLEVPMSAERLYLQPDAPTEELKTVNELWQWMFERAPKPEEHPSSDALNVKITGLLPQDVTASAGFMLFDEEDLYPEKAVASINVSFVRTDGLEYIPEAPLEVTVSGSPIKHVISEGNPYFIVYAHDEYNAMEALIVDEEEFTSDVTVHRALPDNPQEAQNEYWTKMSERLSYSTFSDHERISFTEDPNGLKTNRDKNRI